jgi:hypothetical protein
MLPLMLAAALPQAPLLMLQQQLLSSQTQL